MSLGIAQLIFPIYPLFLVAFWEVPFPHIYCWSALVIWRTWLVSLSNIWQPTSCSTPLPKLAPSSTLWTSLTATKSRTLDFCTFVVSLDVADLDLIGKWDLSWGKAARLDSYFFKWQVTAQGRIYQSIFIKMFCAHCKWRKFYLKCDACNGSVDKETSTRLISNYLKNVSISQ